MQDLPLFSRLFLITFPHPIAEGALQPSLRGEKVILTEARPFRVVNILKPAEGRLSLMYGARTDPYRKQRARYDDSPYSLAPVVAHDGYLSISLADSTELFASARA
jgi:hypothetical protein